MCCISAFKETLRSKAGLACSCAHTRLHASFFLSYNDPKRWRPLARPIDTAWSESDWFGHRAGPIGQTPRPIKWGARFAESSNSRKREDGGEVHRVSHTDGRSRAER